MTSKFLRLCGLFVAACSLHAAPLWSRLDSGAVATVVDPAGPIGRVRTGLIDSAWMQVLRSDGSEAWHRGISLKSRSPQRSPRIKVLAPTPDGGWVLVLDSSNTRMNGSAVFRFDSTGNLVGTPFGVRHDTSLSVSVVAQPTGTWMAAVSDGDSGTTFHLHDTSGAFRDSLRIVGPGFRSFSPFGSGVVALFERYIDVQCISTFLRLESSEAGIQGIGADTIVHPGYFAKVKTLGAGPDERLVFLSDTGRLVVTGTRRPRARVTVWNPADSGFPRSVDTTVDLLLPQDAWKLPDSGLRIVGSREVASPVGAFRSEVAFVDLGPTGAVRRSRQLRTGATAYAGVVSVVCAGAPNGGRGFVGRTSSNAPDTLIELDANGDSLRPLVFPTRYESNLWVLQEGGPLFSRGISTTSGGGIALEAWDLSSAAEVRRDGKRVAQVRSLPGRIELDLVAPVRSARLRIVDARGTVVSDRELGALGAGRSTLRTDGHGVRWAVLDLDDRSTGIPLIDP